MIWKIEYNNNLLYIRRKTGFKYNYDLMRTEKLRKDIIDKRQFSEKPPFILKISVKFENKM